MITSRTNKRVAAIRKLRGRREREETGLFWAEGIRIVVEAARLGATIETLVVAPGLLRSQVAKDLVAAQRATGTPCLEVSADVFGSLSVKEGPQGLGAVVRQSWTALEQLMAAVTSGPAPLAAPARASGGTAPARTPEDPPLWVALDSIQDPGNLGTIIRTSDAAGGRGVILAGNTTDPYDPASVRASMGSLFAQRLARAGFEELLAWARRNGLAVVGTSGAAATAHSAPDCAATYRRPLVLLMGSEREGLSSEGQAACDLVVKIPMVGRCDSLNLAVATGIVLYEIRGRRGGAA